MAKFAARDGAASFDRPIPVTRAGLDRMRDICTPEERCRLILCDEDGTPREPAALWLTEVGQPVRPNSWEVIFTRACNAMPRLDGELEAEHRIGLRSLRRDRRKGDRPALAGTPAHTP